jgi:hypothetical protein
VSTLSRAAREKKVANLVEAAQRCMKDSLFFYGLHERVLVLRHCKPRLEPTFASTANLYAARAVEYAARAAHHVFILHPDLRS